MEWRISNDYVDYETAIAAMEARVAAIAAGQARELVWLLEHPPLYTAGTSAKAGDLLEARFPVHATGRGGQYTYHGPGQRVAYVMLDLKRRARAQVSPLPPGALDEPAEPEAGGTPDLRRYVQTLEQWIINTLAYFSITGFTRDGRVGVWVNTQAGTSGGRHGPEASAGSDRTSESKIAALGIRVRRGVSYHGIALNVNPDLSHYRGIVPCGIAQFGVTSLHALGVSVSMAEVDSVLRTAFEGLVIPCPADETPAPPMPQPAAR